MKTIILKWNPAISSFTMEDLRGTVLDLIFPYESGFNWSVYEWEKAEKGDRVFFLRVGRGKTGILASGWLSSDPYEGDDWRGGDKQIHYADIMFDTMIYPWGRDILQTSVLKSEIPTVDWNGGHSGVFVNEEESNRLEELWKSFLKKNADTIRPDDPGSFIGFQERAWGIAFNAHKGQVDKAGKDYFTAHIKDVYDRVEPSVDDSRCITKTVALLHDVVEDTDWTIEKLREEGFSEEILETVACVTKQEGEDYDHFVERVKSNRFARAVKIADLESNMDITRLNELTDVDVERLRKYHKAYKYLIND